MGFNSGFKGLITNAMLRQTLITAARSQQKPITSARL